MTTALTDLQYRLMDAIAHAEHNTTNGATPTRASDVNTWWWPDELATQLGISERALGGVATSLTEAGLLGIDAHANRNRRRGEPDENSVWFTEAGFEAWRLGRLRAAVRTALTNAYEGGIEEMLTVNPETEVASLLDCDADVAEIAESIAEPGSEKSLEVEAAIEAHVREWQAERTAPAPKRGRPRKARPPKEPVQRADHAETDVIEVLVTPKAREGSLRAARYACFRTGMTVREYLDEAARAAPTRPRFKRHADLIRMEDEGYIRVVDAASWAERLEMPPVDRTDPRLA